VIGTETCAGKPFPSGHIKGGVTPNDKVSQTIARDYVAAKATYIRLLLWQNGGFSALAP